MTIASFLNPPMVIETMGTPALLVMEHVLHSFAVYTAIWSDAAWLTLLSKMYLLQHWPQKVPLLF